MRFLPLLLLIPFLMGATYYVDCDDGSCSEATDCGATGTPCCDLQDMQENTALTSGDTVVLRAGTCTGANVTGWHCNQPNTEFYTHANLTVSGVTYQVNSTDTFTIDCENDLEVGICIEGDNITLDAASGTFQVLNSDDTEREITYGRRGAVEVYDATGITITGLDVDVGDAAGDQAQIDGLLDNHYCFLFDGGTSGLTVEDSTCTGEFNVGLWFRSVMVNNGDDGIVIRNNTLTNSRPAGSDGAATGIRTITSGSGGNVDNFLIYNNTIDYTSTGAAAKKRAFYLRETAAPLYIFNNFINGADYFMNLQDDSYFNGVAYATEEIHAFNNTIIASAAPVYGIQTYTRINMDVTNNIFYGFSVLMDVNAVVSESGTHDNDAAVTAADELTYNVCYISGDTCNTTPTGETWDGLVTGNVTTDPDINTSTGVVQSATGSGVGSGDVDPEDGADGSTCSVTANSLTATCSNDYEDDTRGSPWDIGMDEFNAEDLVPPTSSITGCALDGASFP